MKRDSKSLDLVDKLFISILVIVFGLVVLQAPISVGLSTLWPNYELVFKSWKEILLGAGLLFLVVIVIRRRAFKLLDNQIVRLIALFAAINIVLVPFFYNGFTPTIAGILINLRYLLFFVLMFAAIKMYPQFYKLFLKVFIGGAVLVIGFGLLQISVLPNDFLKYIGYNETTIQPYLTVDQNPDYIRINSTLRGPNPLGAYAVIVLTSLLAYWFLSPKRLNKAKLIAIAVLAVGGAVVLWASYSRSAVLGLLLAVLAVALAVFGGKVSKGLWVGLGIACLALVGSVIALKDTPFVAQVVMHENPSDSNNVNSNEGHVDSLVDGVNRFITQPLGGGVGSTGSPSLMGNKPLIIENQYLYIAHETGWLGLGMFLAIFGLVLRKLWSERQYWLPLSVFASGIGLGFVGLLLPVWADGTVALIWWGLAGVALGLSLDKSDDEAQQGKVKRGVGKKGMVKNIKKPGLSK